MITYLRLTTSGAAGSSLGTTIKFLRRRSPAAHNKRRRWQRPWCHDQVPATHNKRRRGQRHGYHD
jgi:hypothetical protein